MPVRRVLCLLALTTCAALLLAPIASGSWLKPTSLVSGQVRVTWRSTIPTLTGLSTVEGAVRYDVVGRTPSPAALAAWAPLEVSPSSDRARRFFGFLLRARATVERYTVTLPGRACGDGQVPEQTTHSVVGDPANALLDTFEPTLDLVRRRGTVDVGLAASGTVRVRTTGTGCANADGEALTSPHPVEPGEEDVTVATMLGDELVRRITLLEDLPVTIGADHSFVLRASRPLSVESRSQGERSSGTIAFDLRVAGPPADQSGRCTTPTDSEVRRLRTPADVRRLARRRGFSRIVVGATKVRGAFDRGARYRLVWGSPEWPCGQSLGTRRAPAMVPLRRAT